MTDRVPSPTLGTALVAGVGLNVATPVEEFPVELRERVTTLARAAGGAASLPEAEEAAVSAVLAAAGELASSSGAQRVRERCRAALFGVGRHARIDGRPAGIIRDLAADGALTLERAGALVEVRAGDLSVEPEGP